MTTNAHRFELIETMRADSQGRIPMLLGHLLRLQTSALSLGFNWPGRVTVEQAIQNALLKMTTSTGSTRVRLIMTPNGELQITTAPLPALQARPLVALAPLTLDSHESLLQHKTTHRPWYEPTTQWLTAHHDFFDLIFVNERGELCEGSRSNIYIKQDNDWVTPPLACGLLGGVMREHLLSTHQVREAVLTRTDFEQPAASLRLSNGLRGWFNVQRTESLFPRRTFP
ncbi:MAG: aminotransferase [Alcaligenaceae bacterium]|nr:MAG: aminotransferase [Alcaligenaceae bacterium]